MNNKGAKIMVISLSIWVILDFCEIIFGLVLSRFLLKKMGHFTRGSCLKFFGGFLLWLHTHRLITPCIVIFYTYTLNQEILNICPCKNFLRMSFLKFESDTRRFLHCEVSQKFKYQPTIIPAPLYLTFSFEKWNFANK